MNIENLNLNLLRALDAMLTEANVTRAAEKLCVTQSAMSNTLKQLRELFQDQLLVRGQLGMVLTPKAEQLKPKLHYLLTELYQLLTDKQEFVPIQSERVFRVGMSDMAEYMLLPYMLDILKKQAPRVALQIAHINHVTSTEPFVHGQFEVATGCYVDDHTRLSKENCLAFEIVVLARRGHPLTQEALTLKKYLAAKHMRVRYRANTSYTNIDAQLAKIDKARNIVITLPHIIPVLFLLQTTDLIATVPSFLTPKLAKRLNLQIYKLPINLPSVMIYTSWLKQNDHEPGLCWLRDIIRQAAGKACQTVDGLVR